MGQDWFARLQKAMSAREGAIKAIARWDEKRLAAETEIAALAAERDRQEQLPDAATVETEAASLTPPFASGTFAPGASGIFIATPQP